jgi:hypothetical protein
MKLIFSFATNGVGKKQDIPLQPRDLLGRVLESNAWTRHDDGNGGGIVLRVVDLVMGKRLNKLYSTKFKGGD